MKKKHCNGAFSTYKIFFSAVVFDYELTTDIIIYRKTTKYLKLKKV